MNINYVNYLKSLRMIGAVDPWKLDDGSPAHALLVSVETALVECNGWAKQEITRSELLNILRSQDILVFSNIDEFVNWKKDKVNPSGKKKFKRSISEERRKQLQNHASEMRSKLKPSTSEKA